MPLSRYQIRNEYSLADPELYKAADKDDPEALLEGVAMAGLVGVLRQLGDLAEFAAEVFHDLHEEVLATAARGHSLMVRVQQLEADFPSIEKAFLLQTNHSSFFYNSGIEWHPNIRMDQNLITAGDMPRFIMDSYEECRGPPRLFLLDKFDVGGAGACLKRYTDPSFFRAETSAFDLSNIDFQREKRTRKGKKKGSRWRNGETPEVLPTPHAKLHQLLLEERIENPISDPARRVKLKRRLNGFPFDSKTGESYMEKFLRIPMTEHKVVNEISVPSSPLKLPANSYESGVDIHEICLGSPDKKFRHESLSPTRDMVGTEQKHDRGELNGVTSENGFPESPRANHSNKAVSTFHEELGEKEIAVDEETKTEGSIDGYQSDDVASELDNYVDALATMESEIDTDSDLRPKSDLHLGVKRRVAGFGSTEAEHQAPPSDSQSMGSSMLSEDGNSSSKKDISSSIYSDTRSISAGNTPLEGEVSTEVLLVNEIREDEGTARPLKQQNVNEDIGLAPSTELYNDDGASEVAEIPAYRSDHVEQTMSNITMTLPSPRQMDADSTPREHVIVEAAEKMPHGHLEPVDDLTDNRVSDSNLNVIVPNGSSPRVTNRKRATKFVDNKYPKTAEILPRQTSEIPWHSRDDSSLGDSAKSRYLDTQSEETLSSLSSTQQPLDELSKDKSITEQPPEWSSTDHSVDRFERENPNIVGTNDEDVDSSVDLTSAINVASEDDKSKSSLESNPKTENAEENRLEEHIGNQIYVPVLLAPHAEEQSPQWTLPVHETRDTATESDNLLSAPDDVILLPSGGQSFEQNLPQPDTRDTVTMSDHVVSECDDMITPAAEVSSGLSSMIEGPNDVHSVDLNTSGATDDIQPVDPVINSAVDLPISVISHLDEKPLETSVLESCKDFRSEDFQISGITDDNHPVVDPAVCMTVDQNDSQVPVMPRLDEKSLDLTGFDVETHSKGAEPDHSISDNMVRPAGEITRDMEHTTESPTACNLKKVQASVIDVQLLDSAEGGISDSGEQILHEYVSLEDEGKMDGATPTINLLWRDAADFIVSPDCKSSNITLSDADAERDEADTASLEGSHEIAMDHGASLCPSINKLDEESLSNCEESSHNQMEAQASVPDSHSEADVTGILKVASPVSDSDVNENFRHDHSEPEVLGKVADSFSPVESSLDLLNAARTSSPLQHIGSGNTEIPSQKSYFTDYTEDISLMPIRDAEEKMVKLSHGQLDKEETKASQDAAKANLELLPQSEQKETADHLYQGRSSYTGSVSSLGDLAVQQSGSEILSEDHYSIGEIGQLNVPFSSSPFELLPEAKIHLEEMPPLPPLPPVQWRMGKHQHASSAQERETLPSNFGAFMSFPPSIADQKPQILNPFLPQYDIAGEDSHVVYENTSSHRASDGPLPVVHHENNNTSQAPLGEAQFANKLLPFPEKSDEISRDDSHVGEKEQVQPSSVTSSEVTSLDTASTYLYKLPHDEECRVEHQVAPETSPPDETLDRASAHSDGNIIPLDNDLLQSKKENEQPQTEIPSPKGEIARRPQEDGHQVSPETHDEETHIQHQVAPGTSSPDEKLDQVPAHSNGNIIPHDNDLHQGKKENEHPVTVMPSLKGEIAWPSQEDGKANGGLTRKLPRQRNPLIDAVVAHDKSKLRKVDQHPRPQIQKADERDSLLEQIRTKSFNLKPTVVTRPSIQGPTTNLRVAAILEKAKTIRQAFAGSDEDDDDDSWSDS